MIRRSLETHLEDCYWVTAEISEMKVNNSGHCYLELVEKGGANHVPRAKANAVIWRSSFSFIDSMFRQQTGNPICAGLKVLVRVEVSYHELYGLSLVVRDIDPTYTLGDMERQRLETIRKLEAQGLLERNRMLPEPPVFQRIAVVSSSKAAGYQDFMNELNGNEFGFRYETDLFNAAMQGLEAEASVVEALLSVAGRQKGYDAVVIIRGGGSQSDLGVFNSYTLCQAVASMPLKVITGIGHDKDSAVADMVASVSLKTPTAVARYLIDKTLAFDNNLTGLADYLKELFSEYADAQQQLLDRYALTLKEATFERLHEQESRLEGMNVFLKEKSRASTAGRLAGLEHLRTELAAAARRYTARHRMETEHAAELLRERTRTRLAEERNRLEALALRLEGFDPVRILKLGYAVARAGDRAVRSVREVRIGQPLDITVSDGTLQAEVTQISRHPENTNRKSAMK